MSSLLQKSLTGLLLVSALWLVFFTKPPSSEMPDRVNIVVWNVTGADETEPVVPNWFNESQSDIRVTTAGVPFAEIERKFLTAVIGRVPPDVFEYFGSVVQWSSRGALLPLDEFIERDGFDRAAIFPALWDEMMWEGETYAIPTGAACDAFYWNRSHFREVGFDPDRPPQTWDELEHYARQLTLYDARGDISRAGYIPGYWSPWGGPLFLFWAVQKGAEFVSSDGRRVHLTSSACVEALDWDAGLFQRLGGEKLIRLRSSFGFGAQHGFMSGQVSMILQKSSFIQELSKFAPDLEYGVAAFPVPETGKPATISGTVWIGIPAGCKHPEAAWKFIRFALETETQLRAAAYIRKKGLAAFFPANIEAARCPEQMALPGMPVFLQSMQWANSPTVVPLAHTVFWREYSRAWDDAVRGQLPAKAALERAEREIQSVLDDQLEYNDFYLETKKKTAMEKRF